MSPFTAWIENAIAALILRQDQTAANGEVAQIHLGAPMVKFAVACPSGISNCRGRCNLSVGLGKEEMPCCLGQYAHTATESHQAGQPLLQSQHEYLQVPFLWKPVVALSWAAYGDRDYLNDAVATCYKASSVVSY